MIRGDARAQSSIFQSIGKAARDWLDETQPRLKALVLQPLVDELTALANGVGGGQAHVSRDGMIAKLASHLQDLIAAHTRPDSAKLRAHKAVAYLRRALLAPVQPGEADQFADSLLGSSVLALVSGHEGATLKLLEKLRDEARRSPKEFVTDFLGDD